MEQEPIEDRLARYEARLHQVEKMSADRDEELRRAVGRLNRAAEYCSRLASRLEQLELDVEQLASNTRLAGGALITPAEPVGSS